MRRHTQFARPRPGDSIQVYHGQVDVVPPSDDISYSISPGADDSKIRPRPKRSLASFASYLGTHHRTVSPISMPEWPSIDWSNPNSLNDKDGVYKPDTELMCTTITQFLSANPSADLPAQYNTFLLHLIEAYHQSKVDIQELQMKMAEETQRNQTILDEFHGAISSRHLDKVGMLQSLETADLKSLHSTGPGNEAIVVRLRKHDSAIQTPRPDIEYETSGQEQKQTGKTRTSERDHLMSSGRRYRGPSTAALGVESSRDHWSTSPFERGMELSCYDISSAESEGEGHQVVMSASNAFSGLEDDVASHLVSWLALRLNCMPGNIICEWSEFLRSTQTELLRTSTSSTLGTLRPNTPTASERFNFLGKNRILPERSNDLIGSNSSLSFRSIRALGHRRGFSFLPGDDSTNSVPPSAFGGQDTNFETNFIRPLPWQDTKQSDRDGLDKLAKAELSGEMAVDSRSQERPKNSLASSTGVSRNPRLDRSGKSAFTTIIGSSSRSSSLSPREPLNINAEHDSLREDLNRPRHSHLAVAAARAAKNGIVNKRTFHRQSSS